MNNTLTDESITEIYGFCNYCHCAIEKGDDLKVDKGNLYHKTCYDQKNCYYDNFDLGDDL